MKEPRFLFRLANSGRYTPADARELLAKIKKLLADRSAEAMNLRVTSDAYEFDVFVPEASFPGIASLIRSVDPILLTRRLDVPEVPQPAGLTIKEARAFFNAERFWEAHEALEPLWKKTTGDEKRLVQGLILCAAALVHSQKNEMGVVPELLQSALQRLEGQPAEYHGLDIGKFRESIQKYKAQPSSVSIRMEERV